MARKLVTKLSKRQCFTLTEKDTLKIASEKFQKYNVGVMPVLNEKDKNIIGIISDNFEQLNIVPMLIITPLVFLGGSFYTINTPVEQPSDLEGLKIRVMESQTAIDMVKSFGGSPTPISYGELYTSLQQGVVDGAENNPPSFYLSRHYEVCKNYILDEHTVLPDVVLMSTHLWNSLNEKEQKWIQESMNLSVIEQRKLWMQSEKESLDAVRAAGVIVSYPDKTKFSEMSKSVIEAYEEDPYLKAFIVKIKNTF